MLGCTQGELMSQLAAILNTDPCDINNIILTSLMLPDAKYRQMFRQLSFVGLDQNMSYYQFCCTAVQCFPNGHIGLHNEKVDVQQESDQPNRSTPEQQKPSCDSAFENKIEQKRYRNNIAERRAESKSHVAFQTLFAQSAISALQESAGLTNKELCEKIDDYIANSRRAVFWKKLQILIPSKSHSQLRDYYNKSFSKCMYKEYISYEDKLALRDVLARMPNAKPAAVVDAFIEITGSDQYFKRNLVMYVVNTKNASQK
ncbi:Hypothetical_protein [Hexamita inflata]|uniref:Hypothetical_protein n=1 Tax=Hexamita inflata TaxID=28002 RepID=A0AA86R6S9_9EUKA|nr:Hypothetical protein HINF_LOCUS31649 [Hexamita inflata]CAI9944007.1 Hypothetical protein HINF_LOCUS31652 [Hexamita inflata]CAI9972481.1 Hypothetical protein HINF_LOCUS60126 [Hexamita inflata]CAI9972483.1 Hypothetical protein HINF_LOCUS60128 [Hexamita inflata]CAI9972485.1 Hypothetical protein HINF_LOCUS60130 [Hexamita inflata]